MKNANRLRILPALLALTLAGCGDDNSIGGVSANCGLAGTSTGSVSGVVTANLGGCAVYAVATSADATGITISAGTAASPTHVVGLARDGGRPAVGSYTIGAGATQFAGTFKFEAGSADRNFVLTGGTVNITASSTGTLSGNLASVTASEISTPANTITITGNFSAKCVATSGSTC